MNEIDGHNTFFPAQEIINPDNFAGRKIEIEMAIKSLCRPGSSILVYGERGVGKTSFVEMIKLIAQDQVELIYRHKLQNLKPFNGFQYKIIYLECDEDVDTSEKVLQRLITSPEGIRGIIGPRVEKMETTVKNSRAINLIKSVLSIGSSYEEKLSSTEFKETSIYELFTNLIISIVQNILEPNEGLLIVIDEFDRVKNNSKIASLIKTLSKNKVKFLLSGIAKSYFDLIESHASIERQLFQGKIRIATMTDEEMEQIFKLIENNTKGFVKFEKGFKEEAKRMSCGYPYYVQLFGQIALDHFISIFGTHQKALVTKDHLSHGLKNFAIYEPKLEGIYLNLIGHDSARELLLKALSIQVPKRIKQADVFGYCKKRGLLHPNPILTHFLAVRNPQVLLRVDKELVSFVDPIFKIYASTRTPVFLKETEDGYCIPLDTD